MYRNILGERMHNHRGDEIRVSMPGERFTPFSLAKKLGARAILESASFKKGRERYSLILVDEAFRVKQEGDSVLISVQGTTNPYPFTEPGDILDALREIADQNRGIISDLPVPGAGIGFFGYDFVRHCDTVRMAKKSDPIGIPESEFIVGHIYIVFDHYTDTIHLVGLNYREHEIDLAARITEVQRRIGDLDFTYLAAPMDFVPFTVTSDEDADRVVFMRGVERIRERIIAGDLLQAVLSRRLVGTSDLEGLEGYRRLRSISPSPYLFYINFGTYEILGASPESLVRLRSEVATIRPIAGTRRRGKNEAEDRELEKELLADPKERAEHLMLVDLARNDLGRVCVPGSVKVSRHMEPEQFSHVIHLVSEVEGSPDPAKKTTDLLRAAFPAGTVSGAPKLRAIEIVSELENYDRSFYAGAVGYLDVHGGFDTCITIRSALVKDKTWYLQAGAGIVYASTPEREWEETNEKLAALRKALMGGLQ